MKWTNLLSSVNIGCQFMLDDDFDASILYIYEKDLCRSVPEHVEFVFNFKEIKD